MRPIYFLALTFLTIFFSVTAYAQEEKKFLHTAVPDYSELRMNNEALVTQVIDPLRIRLRDGRIVQLTGIDIPDLTPYDSGPVGLAAMDMLKTLLQDRHVKIFQVDGKKGVMNRMGYHLAHLEEKNDRVWIQGALLKNGLARVRPSAVNTEMAAQMLALEGEARAAKRGLWADEQYAALTPENAAQAMHGWAIVEGRVHASAMANNTVYLNFAPDWRTDFTIGIKSAARRALANRGTPALQLANKYVRVRGWVEDYNGPYIELMDPVWIEILPEPGEASNLAAENN